MKRSNKKGFTIVELVIVIAIIAILAAVLIPTFASLIQKANESNDIQAAKNMNTFLAMANVTDGVDSILDVYDLFESSGYSVESYKPLYAGRSYYYDKQANQIVYVDDATGKILYPTERKDQLQGDHDWMSLSLTMPELKAPAGYSAEKTEVTVGTPQEYAWVVNEYNNGKIKGDLTIKLSEDLDFKGAMCVFHNVTTKLTICSATVGTRVTIKNVTSNVLLDKGEVHNAEGVKADYYSGGIIAKLTGSNSSCTNVEFKDITFENINVKTPTAGGVGLLVGQTMGQCSVTMKNVTVKNSTVIGHRDVGALVGAMQGAGQGIGTLTLGGTITLDNVKVKTTGGRSGLIVGKVMARDKAKVTVETGCNIVCNSSAMSIYEDVDLEQKFAAPDAVPTDWNFTEAANWSDMDKFIHSLKATDGSKGYSVYGYKSDALVMVQSDKWEAITTADALKSYNWAN